MGKIDWESPVAPEIRKPWLGELGHLKAAARPLGFGLAAGAAAAGCWIVWSSITLSAAGPSLPEVLEPAERPSVIPAPVPVKTVSVPPSGLFSKQEAPSAPDAGSPRWTHDVAKEAASPRDGTRERVPSASAYARASGKGNDALDLLEARMGGFATGKRPLVTIDIDTMKAAAEALEVEGEGETARVTAGVNLRSKASGSSEVLAVIPEGGEVSVHSCETWCRVSWKDDVGYVFSDYVAGYERKGRGRTASEQEVSAKTEEPQKRSFLQRLFSGGKDSSGR